MKRIVLVSALHDDRVFIEKVAASCLCPFIHSANLSPEVLAADASDTLWILDARSVLELDAASQEFLKKQHPNRVHLIGSKDDLETLRTAWSALPAGHLIIRNYGVPDESAKHYSRIFSSLDVPLGSGLQGFRFDEGKIEVLRITDVSTKGTATDFVASRLLEAGMGKRIADIITTCVDELLMNALYDAPAKGGGGGAKRPAEVELQVGFDDEYVGFTIVDHIGSLERKDVFEHMLRNEQGQLHVNTQPDRGAGIGLAVSFRMGASFYFDCRPGAKTEASVFFKRSNRMDEFRRQFSFVSTRF